MLPTPVTIIALRAPTSTLQNTPDCLLRVQELHQGAYLGYTTRRKLPTTGGVRALWEEPSLPETIFYTIAFNESLNNFTTQSVNNQTRLISLWDAGNQLIVSMQPLPPFPPWQCD